MRRPGHPSSSFPMIDGSWRPLLRPPPGLSESQRELFATITSTCKPDHFKEADVPLIALYVQSLELAQQTAAVVARDPAKASAPLLKSYELSQRRVLGLAQKLRLAPQSRRSNISARSADAGRVPSYYDYMNSLEAGGTDEGWKP